MKDLKYYLSLPYTVVLRKDQDGDVVGHVSELQGCSMHGRTEAQALKKLNETKEDWLVDAIENGDPIPEPEPEEFLPSGKWLQRVPRSLHMRLSQVAKKEGVSLNQWVTAILAEAVGHRNPADAIPSPIAGGGAGARGARTVASRAEDRGPVRYKADAKEKRKARR